MPQTECYERALAAYKEGPINFHKWLADQTYVFPETNWKKAFTRSIIPPQDIKVAEIVGFSDSGKTSVLTRLGNYPQLQCFPELQGLPFIDLDDPTEKSVPSILSLFANLLQKLGSSQLISRNKDLENRTLMERGPFDALVDYFSILSLMKDRKNYVDMYFTPLSLSFLHCLHLFESINAVIILEADNYKTIENRRKKAGKEEKLYSSREYYEVWSRSLSFAISFIFSNYSRREKGLMILDSNSPVGYNSRRIVKYLGLKRKTT